MCTMCGEGDDEGGCGGGSGGGDGGGDNGGGVGGGYCVRQEKKHYNQCNKYHHQAYN